MFHGTALLIPRASASVGSVAVVSGASRTPEPATPLRQTRITLVPPVRRPAPLGLRDFVGMGLGVLLTFLVSYALGRHRIFWEDEMLGWMLLRDPSWTHMIHAWKLGADGGGFAFYLTGRGWFALFGPSENSFRCYAAAGFSLAFCATWVMARRYYGAVVVAFALLNTWFFSPWVVARMAEGRFYGLLTLSAALAVWLVVRADRTDKAPVLLCLLAFAVHGVLSTSHVLGFVYSANLLYALWLTDWIAGRRRTALYLSGAAAWLFLIPERTAIFASAAVGKPHFWTVRPTFSRFLAAYTGFSSEIALVEGLVLIIAAYSLAKDPVGWRTRLTQAYRARRAIYVVVAVLFLVPLEMLAESVVGPSLFINRYLMPLAVAQTFLTAEALSLIAWDRFSLATTIWRRSWMRAGAAAVFLLCLLGWDLRHVKAEAVSPVDFTQDTTARMPHNLPVVCEDALKFVELIGRQHASGVQYTYLLDWPFAVSPEAPRAEVTQYHLMQNWQSAGYFSGSIQQRNAFLQEHPKFLVLQGGFSLHRAAAPEISSNPLVERFSRDPSYQVLPYGPKPKSGSQDLWIVCRGGC